MTSLNLQLEAIRTGSLSKSTLCCHNSQSVLFSLRVRSWPMAWLSNPLTQTFLSYFSFHPLVYVPETLWQWSFFQTLKLSPTYRVVYIFLTFHFVKILFISQPSINISVPTLYPPRLSQVCQVPGVEGGSWGEKGRIVLKCLEIMQQISILSRTRGDRLAVVAADWRT